MTLVYNYLLESYPVKREVMYPAHKRSELKKVYNNIVSLSKRSPLYKVNLSKENQDYIIGIKEAALELKVRLAGMSQPENSGFDSKTVAISDERVLEAKLLAEDTKGLPDTMSFEVTSLASVQTNSGKELLLESKGLPPGTYEFYAKVGEQTRKLTYLHERRMENQEALKKMAEYLNLAVPGVKAAVEAGKREGYGKLVIVSEQAGKNGEMAFQFTDSENYQTGVTDYFGMNRVEKASTQAHFSINGVNRQTATNVFNLEGKLRITLKDTSEEQVTIGIVPDGDKILTAVEAVLNTYNGLIRLAHNRTRDNGEHYRASKLIGEMKSLEKVYGEEVEACGIEADENGYLSLKDPLAVLAARDGGMESLFSRENGFIARLMDKAEAIAINPMEYLDKTVVTYPDAEGKTYPNPYITSMYSGLFFSSYC